MVYTSNSLNIYIRFLLFALIFSVMSAAVYLIILYNSQVSLEQQISDAKKSIKEITIENASLQNKIFEYNSKDNISLRAEQLGLVIENNPIYLRVKAEWLLATQ